METKIFMKSAGRRGYSRLARVMTLAVMLLAMTTGAWAQDSWQSSSSQSSNTVTLTNIKVTFNGDWTFSDSGAQGSSNGQTITIAPTADGDFTLYFGGSITESKAVHMYDADHNELFGSKTNDPSVSVKGKGVAFNIGEGVVYTLKASKTYTFSVSGTKWILAWFTFAAPAAPTKYNVTMAEGTVDAENWTARAGSEGEFKALPLEGVDKGTKITATYSGTKHVKSVTAVTKAAAPAATVVDLSKLTADYEAKDGDVLTGTTTSYKVTIADGAKVTLDGVTISSSYYCIKCAGSATIILKDGTTNTLTSTSQGYPALWAGDAGTTLTIKGSTGALNVTSGQYCAGIGGGYMNTSNTCGNIRIEGGVITAKGGEFGAGIGSDSARANCGNIDITGGTIVATGGTCAAGIGSGDGSINTTSCGNITIKKTVTSVTATKGSNAPNSIGAGCGSNASCGTVTIEEGANVTQN